MQTHERIEQLDHHLNQIIYLLKQKPNKGIFSAFNFSKNYLYEKTWTLVIGTPNSGKTAFLQQAELNVIQETSEENTDCSTWFSSDGVFIELPSLSLENIEENASLDPFIQAIKTHRRKKPFDNILLMINMYSFIQEYDRYMLYLEALKEQLQKLLNPYLTERINLYIVFTHMDKVAGFCDFFTEFSAQQTTQALGYIFEDYQSKTKLMEQHEKKYDRFLGRLHENLVTLLHKTRHNLTRYLIREFPQQLDSLRNMIRSSISYLADVNEPLLKIKGVFFSSACQSGVCVDRISIPVSQSYQLTLSNHFPQAHRTQPYFIKGIIRAICKDHHPDDTRFARYRHEHKMLAYTGYVISAIILMGISIGYYFTVQHLQTAQFALNQYQVLSKEGPLTNMLPTLTTLAKARKSLNEMHAWFIPFQGFDQTKLWVNTQYDNELSQQFLPQLAGQIEKQLLNERNPALQYELLKAYLMLGEPQYLDMNFLTHWLKNYFHLPSTDDLKVSLLQPFPGIELNQNIINQVRTKLNMLPPQYLMYMMIKNAPTKLISLHNDIFSDLSSAKGIPVFYTREGFEEHYTLTIPETINQTIDQTWIIDLRSAELSKANLIEQVQELYFADYINWWKLFIFHVQPRTFTTYQEAIVYFDKLTNKVSPLTQMLQFIQSNTSIIAHPNTVQEVFNTHIAASLMDINMIATEIPQQTKQVFSKMHRYFSMMAKNKNKQASAFSTAKQRFSDSNKTGALNQLVQIAQTTPEPMQQWLAQIASNAWYLILSEAKNYVSLQWENELFPIYKEKIKAFFPVNASSKQDISLENFNRFFGRQGELSVFFEKYLRPFLNMETAEWTPKKIDGFEFGLQSNIILEFERANVIKEMFFPNEHSTLSTNFILQPMELQPIIGRATLNINGQSLVATQNNKSTAYFNWPGKNYTTIPVTLTIQNITGEQVDVTEYGPWGLFRLLAHANIQTTKNDSKTLMLIFDLNGNSVQYLMKTSRTINPFIPDILSSFQLPEAITE